MTGPADEHQRTMTFAETAFSQLKSLRQVATPRNYEIWYAYATGQNPSLNQIVKDLLARDGTLRDADLEQAGARFVSPGGIADQIDTVGSRMNDEIERVVATMDTAVGSTNTYSDNLDRVSETLGDIKKRDDLRAVIADLVLSLGEMKEMNRTLESRLDSSRSEISQLRKNLEIIRNESQSDPLTGLANRKSFDLLLPKAMAEAVERNEPLSLMIGDIDHFKKFNDTWGHLTGDQVLRLVASLLKENFKGRDIIARYGGEEFVIVLPNTKLRSAYAVADQFRRAVMSKVVTNRMTGQNLGRVMMSVGVAHARATDTVESLIGRADACLYAAKRNGRNRVICETDSEFVSHQMKTMVA
jgi:diguanylate cyclase